MTSNHTPGPWQAIGTLDEDNPHIIKAQPHSALRGFTKTICSGIHSPMDAALIAAAPEMYEALKGILYEFPDDAEDPFIGLQSARAAIAKAEGRS